MNLKEAFEKAKRRFAKYGAVFAHEQLFWDDDSNEDHWKIWVSVMFNSQCREIAGEPCWQAESEVSFEEAIANLEGQLKPLAELMEESNVLPS